MKRIKFFLLVGLCFLSLLIKAQNEKYTVQKLFSFPNKNVEEIFITKKRLYIKTTDTLFVVSKSGKVKEKKQSVNKYHVFEETNTYSLENNVITDNTNQKTIDLSKKIKNRKKVAKYLTKAGDLFYTCILDTPKLSYSSNISKVVNGDEILLFSYIVGNPAGLYSDGEFLWYLYNKTLTKSKGMLRKYELRTGKLIFETEIPVVNPSGIYVKGKLLFTYSNYSGELIQLTQGGQ